MKKFVVTIGREFGCSASEVGRKLAAKLGVNFYEKELVEKASIYMNAGENTVFNPDRKKAEKDLMRHFINEFDYGGTGSYFSESAVKAQAFVIRQIANNESCVMFGRCADYFLADYDNALNVFLYAPLAFRQQHVSSAYNLTLKDAQKLIKKIDKMRHNWYKYVTGHGRGARTGRDLLINMETFTLDEAVEIIMGSLILKFNV